MKKSKEDFSKGFVKSANAICAAALQCGNFYLGLAYVFLLVVGGIIINRPVNK